MSLISSSLPKAHLNNTSVFFPLDFSEAAALSISQGKGKEKRYMDSALRRLGRDWNISVSFRSRKFIFARNPCKLVSKNRVFELAESGT